MFGWATACGLNRTIAVRLPEGAIPPNEPTPLLEGEQVLWTLGQGLPDGRRERVASVKGFRRAASVKGFRHGTKGEIPVGVPRSGW